MVSVGARSMTAATMSISEHFDQQPLVAVHVSVERRRHRAPSRLILMAKLLDFGDGSARGTWQQVDEGGDLGALRVCMHCR